MAEVSTDLATIPIVDSVVNSTFVQSAVKSPSEVLQQAIDIPNFSTSNFNITLYPPSTDTIVDAKLFLRTRVRLSLAGLTRANNELCPVNFPLASGMESVNLSVNGSSTSTRPSELLRVFQHMYTDSDYRALQGYTPTQPDYSSSIRKQQAFYDANLLNANNVQIALAQAAMFGWGGTGVYGALAAPVAGGTEVHHYPRVRIPNPNSPYGFEHEKAHGGFGEQSRASFPVQEDTNALIYEFTEPILHSLFEDSLMSNKGIANVRQLTIDIRWHSNLIEKMFQSETGLALVGGTPTFEFQKPEILVQFIRPSQDNAVPNTLTLPYREWSQVQQAYTSHDANPNNAGPQDFVSNNLTFSVMPSKLIIYGGLKINDYRFTTSRSTFLTIDNVSITIGTKANMLSAMTPQQLYQMSVRNGLCMTWNQFSKRTGSIVIVDVAKDLGLIPSVAGRVSCSVRVKTRNTAWQDPEIVTGSANAVGPLSGLGQSSFLVSRDSGPLTNFTGWEMHVLSQLEGKIVITPASSSTSLGLSYEEIKEALDSEDTYANVLGQGVMGEGASGGFMLPLAAFMLGKRLAGAGMEEDMDGYGRGRLGGGINGGGKAKRLFSKLGKDFYSTFVKPVGKDIGDVARLSIGQRLVDPRYKGATAVDIQTQPPPSVLLR